MEGFTMQPLVRTARTTGLFYLGLAVAGVLGFLLIRPQLYVAGDPAATLANLTEHESLARAGVAFELLIVLTQALAAAWFYRLFRRADPVNALGIAAFGLINSTVILISAAMLGTALEGPRDAETVQSLFLLSDNLWGVGAIFFGLWLMPMGRCVLNSGWMPRPLGWVLVAGGVGYVAGAFLRYLLPDPGILTDLVALPASVGEFWIVGYLLIFGVRRSVTTAPGPDDQHGDVGPAATVPTAGRPHQ
ncbi:DUF4386 domain-containing protein [Actinoplanes sp. NPDC051861]|uniref:DUF4386 domain-containing protein n=1 Tax=Actinoplanes sp. NPDC051861 TaxID=3155170 RepID=UPI003439B589